MRTALGKGKREKVTEREANEVRRRKEHQIAGGLVHRDKPRGRMTLGELKTTYRQRRERGETGRGYLRGAPKLSEATIVDHLMTIRYLIEHFGEDHGLHRISLADAERFVEGLAAGKLASARKESKRQYGLGGDTIRNHIRNTKTIFNWARRFRMVAENPFADFECGPLPSKPNHGVSLKDFERLVKSAESDNWRALFGLCRLAGLRRSEAIDLPWSGKATDKRGQEHWVGVDRFRRRISLVAAKTRMHRVVPICPRLYELLDPLFAVDGEGTVTGISPHNLTRKAQEQARAAKLKPWPKFYQAMRSSCENDWKEKGVAEPTYCARLGHSPKVSRESYVSPTEAEYAAVTEAAA